MKKNKDEYLRFFRHMENEHKKEALGGMAWDEVGWWIHDAVDVDKLFTLEELHKLFPILIRSQEQINHANAEWDMIQEWLSKQTWMKG